MTTMITTVLLVLIILVVLGLMLNIITDANTNDASDTNTNDASDVNMNDAKTNAIKSILRGSSRYALASLQDRSPMIALLHANYGAGYFWAMRDAFNSTDIENATGITPLKI